MRLYTSRLRPGPFSTFNDVYVERKWHSSCWVIISTGLHVAENPNRAEGLDSEWNLRLILSFANKPV